MMSHAARPQQRRPLAGEFLSDAWNTDLVGSLLKGGSRRQGPPFPRLACTDLIRYMTWEVLTSDKRSRVNKL